MRKNRFEYQAQYMIGLVSIVIIILLFLNILLGLAQTDKADFYLRDTSYQSFGWEYEILSDGDVTVETPEFGAYDAISFPEKSIQAVSISRVMTEEIPRAPEIETVHYNYQLIEIFLDDLLLFSELPDGERNEEGFLLLDGTNPVIQKKASLKHEFYPYGNTMRLSLPDDYQGKTLRIITYFFGEVPIFGEVPNYEPVYPSLGSYESRYAPYLADLVMPIAALILYAVCIVLLIVVFVLDIPNGRKDVRIFLLALYFLFLFIYTLKGPTVSVVAETDDHAVVQILGEYYILPLCLYLALLFGDWKRWLLLGGTAVWSVYIALQLRTTAGSGYFAADAEGKGSFLLALLFLLVFLLDFIVCKRKQVDRKRALMYAVLAMTVFALCVFSEARRAYNGDILECLELVFSLAFAGYFIALMSLIQNTCAAMAIIVLVVEFLRRSTETRTMVTVLEERSRATREEYHRMLDAENATHSLRHEMSHHLTALMGFLREGENERAEEYIASVVKELNGLPVFRYSQNTIVNVIAGSYLDRAAKEGIRIEHKLSVPETLAILDEDLSVFLSNMLQNALEACERMAPASERYIHINMNVHGNYLAIGCTNSISPEQEKASDSAPQSQRTGRRHGHGYGLKAMSNIAEKYGSILNIEKDSSRFSVKTILNLKLIDRKEEA